MQKHHRFSLWYVLIAIWGVLLLNNFIVTTYGPKNLPYSEFLQKLQAGDINEVSITGDVISGTMKDQENGEAKTVDFTTRRVDQNLSTELSKYNVHFRAQPESTFLRDILSWVIPILLFFGIWYVLMQRLNPGSGVMAFGKNKARVYAEKDLPTRFTDVAGCDEAKAELVEIIDYLKTPERFQRLGGQMPKGVLLIGPPGTGKTLLARAVAGEAQVPFFSISGSEFVEMFVGVGAARVRELFVQAKEKAPCIIFIDELDAIGKSRAGAIVGGHDEREQTLNQLLVEMDGFDPRVGVIIMAATNRPETLDPALLRAGRFDRQVLVDKPDVAGRDAILRVHAAKIVLGNDVDLSVIARKTPGFSGADLANVINEAALLAARKDKDAVGMPDLEEAVDRLMGGLEKKNKVINPKEKKVVAYHEAGHALVATFTAGADAVHKISIVPRGIGALGWTQQLPTEDRYLMTHLELLGKIDVLLGGRGAERLVFGDVSTGAHNDLQRATDIARAMVAEYGMGQTLGPATYPRQNRPVFLGADQGGLAGREYSEATAAKLDTEIKEILVASQERVAELLGSHREELERVAGTLLEKESLDEAEFKALLGQAGATA
ncbi:ATP-dependent metalloprotease FtsH [Solidesulfovibrio carbinoliphilus subsp. oakridgensis]|uniref:ATP-dependent zinc metalloprotease FtsH n=1 Tax=Solidesulfovibrio carbinoliphilus subsp. oakridgensis TaxID=694327 RepID=G7QCZ6_9BACT|nr:ATP-dependent zinc metalloprotease FtsH [Solidesulfovibrio carbinoliphilus]EHJ46302.1 ATP-dependent metalloprotease FtsH [Solidesulfovibrio carbinoliphilus subsp. oakridgensis]